ncbi:MAG: hypothetical protein IPM49_00655 [Flavobacteriales bacterium]|nr:hypothetical protein [Flavobacteriales bacterium]
MSEHPLLPVLRGTLTTFAQAILRTPWYGKEREAVSYYAFGFLAKACAPGAVLHDPGQIAMEGRMQGGPLNRKKEVCKDLVIWPAPGANCWSADRKALHYPLVVMEWKANSAQFFPYDLEHLASLTRQAPQMLGIAVTFDARRKEVLRAARVVAGTVEEGWLEVR